MALGIAVLTRVLFGSAVALPSGASLTWPCSRTTAERSWPATAESPSTKWLNTRMWNPPGPASWLLTSPKSTASHSDCCLATASGSGTSPPDRTNTCCWWTRFPPTCCWPFSSSRFSRRTSVKAFCAERRKAPALARKSRSRAKPPESLRFIFSTSWARFWSRTPCRRSWKKSCSISWRSCSAHATSPSRCTSRTTAPTRPRVTRSCSAWSRRACLRCEQSCRSCWRRSCRPPTPPRSTSSSSASSRIVRCRRTSRRCWSWCWPCTRSGCPPWSKTRSGLRATLRGEIPCPTCWGRWAPIHGTANHSQVQNAHSRLPL